MGITFVRDRVTIRALVQIDRLQPKFAAYNGATVQGSIPLAGDTILIGELAPGNEVFGLVDAALKASRVEATSQIVEREFGFFILRSPLNAEVTAARDAILARLGMGMSDRLRPVVESTQIITSVEPYQAQLLNKWSSGSLLVPGRTLGVLECAPAAYVGACRQRGGEGGGDRHRGGAGARPLRAHVHLRERGVRRDRDGGVRRHHRRR